MKNLIPNKLEDFTQEKIKELMKIQSIESETFDFKRTINKQEKYGLRGEKHICAMLNTFGGFIILGIDEDKENEKDPFVAHGINDIRKEEIHVSEAISKNRRMSKV